MRFHSQQERLKRTGLQVCCNTRKRMDRSGDVDRAKKSAGHLGAIDDMQRLNERFLLPVRIEELRKIGNANVESN